MANDIDPPEQSLLTEILPTSVSNRTFPPNTPAVCVTVRALPLATMRPAAPTAGKNRRRSKPSTENTQVPATARRGFAEQATGVTRRADPVTTSPLLLPTRNISVPL